MSPDTISTFTDAVLDEVLIWQNRQLDEFYPVIFLDALRVKTRVGHRVINKAWYMVVGVDMDGIKHILGLWIRGCGLRTMKVLVSGPRSRFS